jgi:hypothetical protein
MGGHTMFELNRQMDQWRDELTSSHSMDDRAVSELLAHLRDEVDALCRAGLSEEEAFWIARHRLGDATVIHAEFSKVNQAVMWRRRMIWLLLGYFIFSMIPGLVRLLAIPFYLLDVKWMFFTTPLLGDRFLMPVPLYGLILLIIGGLFFLVGGQKHRDPENRFSSNLARSGHKVGYATVLSVLGLYVIIAFSGFVSTLLITRYYDVETFGQISASGSAFSLLWQCFLFLSLVLYMCLVYPKKHDKTVRHGA